MSKSPTVQNINTDVLRQCREQMALSIADVKEKVASIEKIEAGEKLPTFKQLETLSKLYAVPEWVFISDKIPEEYIFEKRIPSFRQFAGHQEGFSSTLRRLTKRVTELRELILDLREDMDEQIQPFGIPQMSDDHTSNAQEVRQWLGVQENDAYTLDKWREKLEEKEIFILLTSKYPGWSCCNKENFRGMAIYYDTLPIIVINDSDAYKAQTFTLFHELGHLLRKKSGLDTDYEEEQWCNDFAGHILMPAEKIPNINSFSIHLDAIEKNAKTFEVSSYAFLVRLRRLNRINQPTYDKIEREICNEFETKKRKLKDSPGGPARYREREVSKQYGKIYISTLFQSYYNKNVTLHKLCLAFGLKRVEPLEKLEHLVSKESSR